jgi:ketosteroid isomerase-like protein
MPDPPLAVAQVFVKAINATDLAALRALMTDDHVFTDALGRSFSGAATMIEGWKFFFAAYPEYRIQVDTAFAVGPRVALFGSASGKWKLQDRILRESWTVAAAWLAHVEDGKVKKWAVFCDTGWATPPASA